MPFIQRALVLEYKLTSTPYKGQKAFPGGTIPRGSNVVPFGHDLSSSSGLQPTAQTELPLSPWVGSCGLLMAYLTPKGRRTDLAMIGVSVGSCIPEAPETLLLLTN